MSLTKQPQDLTIINFSSRDRKLRQHLRSVDVCEVKVVFWPVWACFCPYGPPRPRPAFPWGPESFLRPWQENTPHENLKISNIHGVAWFLAAHLWTLSVTLSSWLLERLAFPVSTEIVWLVKPLIPKVVKDNKQWDALQLISQSLTKSGPRDWILCIHIRDLGDVFHDTQS